MISTPTPRTSTTPMVIPAMNQRARRRAVDTGAAVLVLGVGVLIIWRLAAQTEEKLAQEAGQAYAENRFGTAAAKYRELTDKYHESARTDEYHFMIDLSELRDQVDNAADGLQDVLKR